MDLSEFKINPFMDTFLLASFFVALAVFLSPRLERSRLWTATVTPLASIIGSGYLVSAPLLHITLGDFAVLGMASIVALAYLIGEALRYNIAYGEGAYTGLERLSNLVLSFAYMVSVAFYLRLLSSFLFSGFFGRNHVLEDTLTTLLLAFIGVSGFLRGLGFLEFLEKYSVAVKLSVICAFTVGLLLWDVEFPSFHLRKEPISFETLQVLAGMLLIVQGFETSKYLGEKYSVRERIKSMKIAQITSAAIYLSFVFLATPLLGKLPQDKADETAVILLAGALSLLLRYLLVVGALMSQFSAAVADTIGAGGLLWKETDGRVSSKVGYLLTACVGIVLVWSANIFEIIVYASKAFALYYLLQTLISLSLAFRRKDILKGVFFSFVLVCLAFVVLFGKSVSA